MSPAQPHCTFGEMLPLFMELFEPDARRTIALAGGIKHLLKLGAAPGVQAGRGNAGHYSREHVWEMLVLMEMNRGMWLQPAMALEIWRANRDAFHRGESVMAELTPSGSGVVVRTERLEAKARQHLPGIFGP